MRVGIEVGGTFTDLLSLDDAGRVLVRKVPSVRSHPDQGAYAALEAAGISLPDVRELVHGSTVATNAVLERSGARVGFVTTRGFRDILFLQRHNRSRVYDLAYEKPLPIVTRKSCHEVSERVLADGTVETPLDEEEVKSRLIPKLAKGNFGAIAICLLNAYRNPTHEAALAELIRRHLPEVMVLCSSEIVREYREYERASTTVIAAHVQPVLSSYLGRFERYLRDRKFSGELTLMQSNGGRTSCAGMRSNPATGLYSGPAAGVMGAIRMAKMAGFQNLVTFDMGGTSTDVCLVENGEPELTGQTEIDGLPLRIPLVDIVSIGAGCGSIVWADEGGMLRVGPISAGSDPGPACYGFGGNAPTITDAHIIRGTLRPEAFLGGTMKIDARASPKVFAGLGRRFRMSLPEIAEAAVRLAEANIVRAIQLVSTERGRDPRDYVLVAYGGAGPLHAARVAEDLAIRTVLIPSNAGVLSAYGLITADYKYFTTETHRVLVDARAPSAVRSIFRKMKNSALRELKLLGTGTDRACAGLTLEMRFVGQAFEIPVHLDAGQVKKLTMDRLLAAFSKAHHRVFFHDMAHRKAAEIVSFRLGLTQTSGHRAILRKAKAPRGGKSTNHSIFVGRGKVRVHLLNRGELRRGKAVKGPAIVEDVTSTIFVPAGWSARVAAGANLVLTRRS
ncbi:MAG: hydantoinase/oxoprolinase family protein [SAR324 cluster bacterium]|nr:hydantoinase/oxoprolinase family protein [SAR324 cluster bacterium]